MNLMNGVFCTGVIMGRTRYHQGKQIKQNNLRRTRDGGGEEGVVRRRNSLGIGMLNLDGVKEQGMMNIGEAINKKELDVFCMIETKLVKEDRKKIEKEGFDVFEQRREKANNDKKGGGLAILMRKKAGVAFKRFHPVIQDPRLAYVEKERMWITYDSQGGKTAICCVYMACNENQGISCVDWNEGIYKVLSAEIFKLRGQGYRITIQGDFNAWVGCELEEGGIPGNRRKTNKNGDLFLGFLRSNNLLHVNGACRVQGDWSTRISKGLWTRHAPDHKSSTIIDYVVVSAEHLEGVLSMEIDEGGELGGKSDHNMITTRLVDKFVVVYHAKKPSTRVGWDIQEDQDWSKFREVVDRELEKLPFDDGTVETLSNDITKVVTKALDETVGKRKPQIEPKDKKLPKNIVELMKESKRREKVWKTAKTEFAASNEGNPSESVLIAAERLDDIDDKVKEALSSFYRMRRKPILKLCKAKSKNAIKTFWNCVSRKTKKTTDITSLQDKRTGILLTKPEDVATEVYKYLQDIFSGVDPEVREEEEDMVLDIEVEDLGDKETGTNEDEGQKLKSEDSSTSVEQDPAGFLDKDFTIEDVRNVIQSLGVGKASGWDAIPNEALKEASRCLVTKLLILYNRVKNKGEVPSAWRRGRLVLIHKKGSTADVYN